MTFWRASISRNSTGSSTLTRCLCPPRTTFKIVGCTLNPCTRLYRMLFVELQWFMCLALCVCKIPEPIQKTDRPVTFDVEILEKIEMFLTPTCSWISFNCPRCDHIATAHQGREHLYFSKISMSKVSSLSVILMGSV